MEKEQKESQFFNDNNMKTRKREEEKEDTSDINSPPLKKRRLENEESNSKDYKIDKDFSKEDSTTTHTNEIHSSKEQRNLVNGGKDVLSNDDTTVQYKNNDLHTTNNGKNTDNNNDESTKTTKSTTENNNCVSKESYETQKNENTNFNTDNKNNNNNTENDEENNNNKKTILTENNKIEHQNVKKQTDTNSNTNINENDLLKQNSVSLIQIPDIIAFNILRYLWDPLDLKNASQISMIFREASNFYNNILWKQSALRPAINSSKTPESKDIYRLLSCDYQNLSSNSNLNQLEKQRQKTEEIVKSSHHLLHRQNAINRLKELCEDLKEQAPENEENLTKYQSQLNELVSKMEILHSERFISELSVILDFRVWLHPLEPPPISDEDSDLYCEDENPPRPIEIFARYTRKGNDKEEDLILFRDYLYLLTLSEEHELHTNTGTISDVAANLNVDVPVDLFSAFLVLALIPMNNSAFNILRSNMNLAGSTIREFRTLDKDEKQAEEEGIDITESDEEDIIQGENIEETEDSYYNDYNNYDYEEMRNQMNRDEYELGDFVVDDFDDKHHHSETSSDNLISSSTSSKRRVIELDSEDSNDEEEQEIIQGDIDDEEGTTNDNVDDTGEGYSLSSGNESD